MKLLELNIEAFGPFSQKKLLFSPPELKDAKGGLHIIYGENEAGKSACLRALKALLYGIPTRTVDNFLHSNNKLRISAQLQHSNGEHLFIRRRKGRINTLLDVDNNPLDDSVLTPYLQGLNQTLFETLFGLDHTALVQGGEAMLAQKGEVGQALFSAGMGIAHLRQLLNRLESDAKGLYAPRGKKPEINHLIVDYKQCLKQIREQSLSAPQWKKQRKQLDDLKKELQQQSDYLNKLKQHHADLKRLKLIADLLAEHKILQQQRNELGEIPTLSAQFTTQRINALKTREDSQKQIELIQTEQLQLSTQQQAIQLDHGLLDNAIALESLQQKVRVYNKEQAELLENEQQQQRLNADNKQLLFLSPQLAQAAESEEKTALVRFLFDKRHRLRDLAPQQSSLQKALQQAQQQKNTAQARLDKAQFALGELETLYETKALKYSIKRSREQGDLEKQRQQLMHAYEKQCTDCQREIQRLGLACEDLNRLDVLPIPAIETVERFKKDFHASHLKAEQYQQQQQQFQQHLQQLEQELKALQLGGEIPTESALKQARTARQQAWKTIRNIALNQEKQQDKAKKTTLLDSFEQQLQAVDQLADRLRRESKRVHKQADLLAQKESHQTQLDALVLELKQITAQQEQLEIQWKELWKAISNDPLPPKEMSAWLRHLQALQEKVSQLNQALQHIEDFNHHYYETCRLIEESLHYTGGFIEDLKSSAYESIDWLLEQAEQRLETLRQRAEKKRALSKEIKAQQHALTTASKECEATEKAWQQWQQQWQQLLEPLGLATDILSVEINELLDNISAWFANNTQLKTLLKKEQYLQQSLQAFETECEALQQRLIPNEPTPLAPDQWLKQYYNTLKEQQTLQQKAQQLKQQQHQQTQLLEQTQQHLQESDKTLTALCQEAHCQQIEELETVENNVKQAQSLETERKHLQQRIEEQCGTASLTERIAQLEQYQEQQLSQEQQTLAEQIQQQSEKRDQLHQESGRLAEQLRQIETQAGAIDSADKKHAILAQMSDKVQLYLRQRLAQRILQQYIESYRQQHQGPVLKRAGEYFATLSCDSFQGLSIDYDNNDQAILMGQRPDNECIGIEGMSDGTRDQLYLSLRLASLEQHLQNAEPLPFILDDILINFDNQRTLAGLNALSQLAEKTQVILFTHHQHLIDLFSEHKQQFVVHNL